VVGRSGGPAGGPDRRGVRLRRRPAGRGRGGRRAGAARRPGRHPGGRGGRPALADTLEAWTADRNVQVLLILDQFEEYFLYHRDEDDEGGFAAQFARAVNRRGIPVSFLVAIREDALAKLDRFKGRIPGLFENYLRVRHLRAGQATRAVTGPLERVSEVDPAAQPVAR